MIPPTALLNTQHRQGDPNKMSEKKVGRHMLTLNVELTVYRSLTVVN